MATVDIKLLSLDRNINYISEGISFMAVKDINRVIQLGYESADIEYDILALRMYLKSINNFRQYLDEKKEEPKWSINIRTIIERSYNIIAKHLGMKHQWSLNDN